MSAESMMYGIIMYVQYYPFQIPLIVNVFTIETTFEQTSMTGISLVEVFTIGVKQVRKMKDGVRDFDGFW
jgi:hypothetical protein